MTGLGRSACLALGVLLASLLFAAPAPALAAGPVFSIEYQAVPSDFLAGDGSGDNFYIVKVENVGTAPTNGSPITITDELPAGLSLDPAGVSSAIEAVKESPPLKDTLACSAGPPLTCSGSPVLHTKVEEHEATSADYISLDVPLDVAAVAPASFPNSITVSGGGAPSVTLTHESTIGAAPTRFGLLPGVEGFSALAETASGAATQAGSHPYAFTTDIHFNQKTNSRGEITVAGDARDVHVALPPGLIGNPTVAGRCTLAQLVTKPVRSEQANPNSEPETSCPDSSSIGVARIQITTSESVIHEGFPEVNVFNLVPPPGAPAAFGFNVAGEGIVLTPHIREDGTYGLTIDSIDTAQGLPLYQTDVTIWGVPGESSHDLERGHCLTENVEIRTNNFERPNSPKEFVSCAASGAAVPYLTLPTSCGGPLTTSLAIDSWQSSGAYLPDGEPDLSDPNWVSAESQGAALDGCNQVPFSPGISAQSTTDLAGSSSGLHFDVNFTNEGLTNAGGVAESNLKKVTVTLPEGFTVNPSAGAGLGACSLGEYEAEGLHSEAAAGCPEDSKLGTVEIESPLVEGKIEGSVYIAKQEENPFDSLLALYVVARNPALGVFIKSAGKVELNPVSGQITTTFDELPQLPFSHLQFSFHQGNTSPLVSPPTCGTYTALAALTPWANPASVLSEGSSFQITGGIGGGPCPSGGVPPFAPQVIAGTEADSAGSYSPLYLRIGRNDGEQELTGFASQLPPGLTANLSGVAFCSEAQIAHARAITGAQEEAEPACPAASEIGHTIAEAGVGSVLAQAPGKLYLAGAFEGAPFSIVSVTSAKVGPFDLGTVVVHLPLQINPETAQVSIPAGPAGQIPHIIKGIVIHVRDIRVYVSRANFTINPTNCSRLSFGATVYGGGANPTVPGDEVPVTVTDPFQASSCASLKFAPKFTATTSGRTSKADGASLSVKLTYPTGVQGTQADISKVKVDLPKQLPSRLTTLQKACTAKQFEANPAGCPAASVIGHAKAITPILPVPLEGPAYFVSHGGEAFPDLEMVLQGYGVKIILTGSTFISKAGITSSTFKAVPDQPITSFELTLPTGKYSALAANLPAAANRSFCGQKLAMPTAFVGQNGAEIHESTAIAVTGCPKAKKAGKKKKAASKKKGRK